MIKLQIIGNLGADCIQKEINGKTVINFNVAHSEKYKDAQGNLKERTTWVNCAYWTDRTAVAQYLTKGRTVYAEGSPEADAYLNKDNQPAATLRMRVLNVQLLGGNDGVQGAGGNMQVNSQGSSQPQGMSSGSNTSSIGSMNNPAPVDDLPF
jgi:single-strand DNA-binding protein